ncbi:MAG: TIGR04219 family outer membrane beta-barrel protein [Sulfurimonas sp.]|nr:TIGR04219 family outer membrane beta-barrel protein [Sulfurimonas sp.]
MRKILTSLAVVGVLASTLSADFARVEMGAGSWMQTPSGYATRTDGDGSLSLNGTYTSNETATSDIYVWALVKHPIPILPNLRLEYVTVTDEGKTSGSVGGLAIPTGSEAPTTMDMTQFDIVPYYNILDNTFWTTIDLGLDIKIIQTDVNVGKVTVVGFTPFDGYSSSDTTAIPLLYARTRVEIPFTGIGFEVDAKAISDGTNTMYDARAKVDYTFNITPLIQPGLEVGYRAQQLRVDDGATQIDLNYSGLYAGLMLRF